MNRGTKWVIVDTETDGLHDPIHIVELAGQMMEGWTPVGEPFRMLLNHNVHIPSSAVAIHGYTRDYLSEHGVDPVLAHREFRNYAGDAPLVAHNLSYDWNRCLAPEWARLGTSPAGKRGFCSMMLARRLVYEVENYKLTTLQERFSVVTERTHNAKSDVLGVVKLFDVVYRPRLTSIGLDTWDAVEAFAKRTPVGKCVDLVRSAISTNAQPVAQADAPARRWQEKKSIVELIGLCRGLIADRVITTSEILYLSSWLEDAGLITEWPAAEIAEKVESILRDGLITSEEQEELRLLLEKLAPLGSE
jgi:DNA polymerase III epsilon subunit-like protein